MSYDTKKIDEYGVFFNDDGVDLILKAYNRSQKENRLLESGGKDSAALLKSLGDLGVLCVYGGKGYGPKWFARKLEKIPSSRQPRLDSVDKISSALKTIVLQNIAVNEGFAAGVKDFFSYQYKRGEMVSGLLYDAYLRLLVNSTPKPDTVNVSAYYEKNKFDKYMDEEKMLIREIKVSNKGVADSLLVLLNAGEDFSVLAQLNSSNNPGGGGVYGPFTRDADQPLFDAASSLADDEISPVLLSSINNFSIIQLIERVAATPMSLERVYVRIESLLIKDGQNRAKIDGVEGLLNKYQIVKNDGVLY